MTCSKCGEKIGQSVMAVSEFIGEHVYTTKHCIEGSPHQHSSCAPYNPADLPAEMLEPMRLAK